MNKRTILLTISFITVSGYMMAKDYDSIRTHDITSNDVKNLCKAGSYGVSGFSNGYRGLNKSEAAAIIRTESVSTCLLSYTKKDEANNLVNALKTHLGANNSQVTAALDSAANYIKTLANSTPRKARSAFDSTITQEDINNAKRVLAFGVLK